MAKSAKKRNPQHSAESDDWGTDGEIVAHMRHTFARGPDLDPCSSSQWNGRIGAAQIITEQMDCRRTRWIPGVPLLEPRQDWRDLPIATLEARVSAPLIHCNPAGDPKGEIVAHCWRNCSALVALGWVRAVYWVGFSVEQLARLQRVGAPTHPLQHPTRIPPERREFETSPGMAGTAPSHANFVTLLRGDAAMLARFVENHSLGATVAPLRIGKV
jgi:hypothetical protein